MLLRTFYINYLEHKTSEKSLFKVTKHSLPVPPLTDTNKRLIQRTDLACIYSRVAGHMEMKYCQLGL